MWSYWRDKHFNVTDALKDYYPNVLAAELSLRLELIRIEAYQALIDKLMDALEERHSDTDEDFSPMWTYHRENNGHKAALERHYAAELKSSEPLQLALQNIREAEAAVDKWMCDKADAEHDEP